MFSKRELEYLQNPLNFELTNPNYAKVLRSRIKKKLYILEYELQLLGGIGLVVRMEASQAVKIIENKLDNKPKASFNKDKFYKYLIKNNVSDYTARKYVNFAVDYLSSNTTVEVYLSKYNNPNTFNNHLKALIHLHRFLGMPKPNVKIRPIVKDNLIIAPSYEQVLQNLAKIESKDVKTFYLLCCTTLLRPQFIATLTKDNFDVSNRLIRVNVHRRTKHYRSQVIHSTLLPLIADFNNFTHTYNYYRIKVKECSGLTPSQLRDFAYNAMLQSGMNPLIVEWLMGHSIGMARHYLADNLKEEYSKFEQRYPFI